MEVWKEIEVKGQRLKVNDSGQVHVPAKTTPFTRSRSQPGKVFIATFKERILKPYKNTSGYLEVCLVHKRRRYRFSIHRLVAIAFVPGFEEDKVVNHIDGDKINNDPSNLEWVMPGENSTHAWMTELVDNRGERSGLAKLNDSQVRAIRRLFTHGVSIGAIARIAQVSSAAVTKIRDHKSWAHLDNLGRLRR